MEERTHAMTLQLIRDGAVNRRLANLRVAMKAKAEQSMAEAAALGEALETAQGELLEQSQPEAQLDQEESKEDSN